MKQYIFGYYCTNDAQLDVISKESNRRILDALRESFPSGLSANDIEEKTGLPLKTVYACLKELNRELFVDQLGKQRKIRGRPLLREVQDGIGERHRSQFVIEDRSRTYEMSNEDNYAMAPGNVDYPQDFIDAWHTIVPKEEEDELCTTLSQFLERSLTRMINHPNEEIRRWSPERSLSGQEDRKSMCCSQCGINHEARDFVRAILLHLLDHLERHGEFIEFMKSSDFLDLESYQTMISNIDKFQRRELGAEKSNIVNLKQMCDHFSNMNQNIPSRTSDCEECKQEGTKSVGLRLCLTCGHVGCSDSSKGMHATKHFVNNNHPLIAVLPDKAWIWCYIHKIYQ